MEEAELSELQIVVECFIQQNGGRDTLAELIEAEWRKYFYPKHLKWTENEVLFLLSNYNTMTCKTIAIRIGRTYDATRHKIELLREKAILDYRKTKKLSTSE